MKKRSNAIVILSSDDDEDDETNNNVKNTRSLRSNSKSNRCNSIPKSSNSKPKPKTSTAKSTNKKKPRISQSLSSSVELFSTFDDLKFLSEDFAHGFAGFKVSTGCKKADGAESWVDKYRPRSVDELAVHKKKVEEVKVWLEGRLNNSKECQNYVLLIIGQAGIGKSATIRAVASHVGAEICEWNTPTPTLWQEHVHNSNAGLRYISKLDEFENFVERVRKYGLLSSCLEASRPSMVLLIEDLPLANGKVAQGRLQRCLELLVRSVQIPTVICITEYSGADSADVSMRYWDEVSSAVESAGACKVAFNPVTVNSLKKALSRICMQEKCSADSEQIDSIANASGGDIRQAIMTLQYFSLKQQRRGLLFSDKCDSEASGLDPVQEDADLSSRLGRDQTLSLFHALGKVLHNKRETDCTMECNEDFYLKEGLTRLPLKMDAPEKVLSQAYGQAKPVADFLFENVLDFLSQEAIEDAWVVSSYLSDTDCLLSSNHRGISRSYEAENVIQSAAASVAVRGVLFGNAHPSPSRWHSIRRPMLWQVEQSARRNMHQIERQRVEGSYGQNLSNLSVVCTEYKPALKWLGSAAFLCNNSIQDDEKDLTNAIDRSTEFSDDDDIEDF
ncbi:cell cycle checkpoint protein RAD17-like [Silene latifolia]|uniref:cell cycle checkpoint protein RAD17-like n=1 Tax=Silene latifolia TaxID=37657 RepID=UPI003D76BDBC